MTTETRKEKPEALDDAEMDKAQGGGKEDTVRVLATTIEVVAPSDNAGGAHFQPHQDMVEVFATSHGVESPRDVASGLPTGKRQHKPFSG